MDNLQNACMKYSPEFSIWHKILMDEIIYLSVGWLLIWHMYYMHLISFSIFFSLVNTIWFLSPISFFFINLSSKMWCSSALHFYFSLVRYFIYSAVFFAFPVCATHTHTLSLTHSIPVISVFHAFRFALHHIAYNDIILVGVLFISSAGCNFCMFYFSPVLDLVSFFFIHLFRGDFLVPWPWHARWPVVIN